MGRATRWAFREIHVKGRRVAAVKKEAQRRFGLTARQFNGVRFDLEQAVGAWRGTLEHRISTLADRIGEVGEKIAATKRRLADPKPWKPLTQRKRARLDQELHQKKRHLQACRDRKAALERELAGAVPRICFGGAGLLREAQAAGEVWRWHAKRSGRILLVGSKDETAGNQSCQWDGERLVLKLPGSGRGERAVIAGVRFRYGQDELLAALARGGAITWLLFRDEAGAWQGRATIDEPPAELVTDLRVGALAVDLNEDHLAVTLVDRLGNSIGRETLPFPVAGTEEGVAAAMIGEAVAQICAWAKALHFGVACEDLDFGRKRAALKAVGRRHARRLSGFAYARFFQLLAARCARDGVDLCKVNPAFTSVIGGTKYARWRGFSRHHAAALVIGRRALGFGERLVCMDGSALDAPARMRPRHAASRWRGVRPRRAREGTPPGEAGRTARSSMGTGGRGRPGASAPRAGPGPGCRSPRPARTSAAPSSGGAAVGPPSERRYA
jgi:IS605 OrfB family transposase